MFTLSCMLLTKKPPLNIKAENGCEVQKRLRNLTWKRQWKYLYLLHHLVKTYMPFLFNTERYSKRKTRIMEKSLRNL